MELINLVADVVMLIGLVLVWRAVRTHGHEDIMTAIGDQADWSGKTTARLNTIDSHISVIYGKFGAAAKKEKQEENRPILSGSGNVFVPPKLKAVPPKGRPATMDRETMKAFGIRLKNLRTRKHLSQEQLGERVGVSGVAVCFWEQGANGVDEDNLKMLARELGVTTEYLKNGANGIGATA